MAGTFERRPDRYSNTFRGPRFSDSQWAQMRMIQVGASCPGDLQAAATTLDQASTGTVTTTIKRSGKVKHFGRNRIVGFPR